VSLMTGALMTDDARKNRKLVVDELNRAFDLQLVVAAKLAKAFGSGYEKNLVSGASIEGTGIHRASEITGGGFEENGHVPPVTMADIIGEPAPDQLIKDGARVGRFAWSQVAAPADFSSPNSGRDILRRVQLALHDREPVPMQWFSDDYHLASNGRYV